MFTENSKSGLTRHELISQRQLHRQRKTRPTQLRRWPTERKAGTTRRTVWGRRNAETMDRQIGHLRVRPQSTTLGEIMPKSQQIPNTYEPRH